MLTAHNRIALFEIDKLFGYITYSIAFSSDTPETILYSENGAGKTTIMELMFHALAPEEGKGHFTYIARISFKRMYIRTTNGFSIEFLRPREDTGPFSIRIESPFADTVECLVDTNNKGTVSFDPDDHPDQASGAIRRSLRMIGLDQILLTDERVILSTLEIFDRPTGAVRIVQRSDGRIERISHKESDLKRLDLDWLSTVVLDYFRRELLDAGKIGSYSDNTIYLQIARDLSQAHTLRNSNYTKQRFQTFSRELEVLSDRYMRSVNFGFASQLPFDEMRSILELAPERRRGPILNVLESYISTIRARLDSTEALVSTIEALTVSVNSYLNFKEVRFDISKGFSVYGMNEGIISFNSLSSGERQILFLFMASVLCRIKPTVFYIDEPELSLNSMWQRKLLRTLLDITAGTSTQFITASHSFEIIAGHRGSAVRLEPLPQG